jgi:hypothetical protein
VPVGKEDYCFCALALQRGFFRRLLSPPVTDDQFRPIQAALDVGLRAMSVSDLRWLTDDEFRKLW